MDNETLPFKQRFDLGPRSIRSSDDKIGLFTYFVNILYLYREEIPGEWIEGRAGFCSLKEMNLLGDFEIREVVFADTGPETIFC